MKTHNKGVTTSWDRAHKVAKILNQSPHLVRQFLGDVPSLKAAIDSGDLDENKLRNSWTRWKQRKNQKSNSNAGRKRKVAVDSDEMVSLALVQKVATLCREHGPHDVARALATYCELCDE